MLRWEWARSLCYFSQLICHSYFRYTRSLMHEAEFFIFYLLHTHTHTRLRSTRVNRVDVKTTTISNSLNYTNPLNMICLHICKTNDTSQKHYICYMSNINIPKFHQISPKLNGISNFQLGISNLFISIFQSTFFSPKLKFGYTWIWKFPNFLCM